MGVKSQEDDDIIADINVTPLVDITLVLLIIFMVTATYIVSPAIKVELPKAQTGETVESTTLSITLVENGTVYLNGEEVSHKILEEKIKTLKKQTKDLQAIIAADKKVFHGDVIKLIDLVRINGITKFAINIDPESALSK